MMLLGRSPASLLLLGFKIDHTSFGVVGWLFTAAGVTEKEKKSCYEDLAEVPGK